MRSISVPFKEVSKKNPGWSDYVCLVEAVRGRQFSYRTIRDFFAQNVSLDDYGKEDFLALVDFLHIASNTVEDNNFRHKIALLDVESLKDVVVCQ